MSPLETESLDYESNLIGGRDRRALSSRSSEKEPSSLPDTGHALCHFTLPADIQDDVPGHYSDGLALHPGSPTLTDS